LFRAARGRHDIENAIDLSVDDVFPIASNTKQFVAAAVLRLVDQGRIALDDRVSKFLPDFPEGDRILIHQLLNHTAGVAEYTSLPEFSSAPPSQPTTISALMSAIRSRPLDFAPGEKQSYSNSGYVVLAAVLESITGKPWARVVIDEVTAPLGLTWTGDGDDPRLARRRPKAYLPDADTYVPAPPYALSFAASSGAMVSTVDDLYRWTRALHGGRVLSPSSYRRMTTPEGAAAQGEEGYGYGLYRQSLRGHPYFGHDGWVPGYVSEVMYLPQEQITVVVLENTDARSPLGNAPVMALRLAAVALGEPFPLPTREKVDTALLKDYVGVYRAGGDERVVRVIDDTLTIQKKGGGRWDIHAAAPDAYVRAGFLQAVHFERSADGHVSGLRVAAQGADLGMLIPRVADPLPDDPVGVPVPREALQRLVGSYWSSGNVLRVTFDERTLRIHVLGQLPSDMVPLSPTRFDVPRVASEVEFADGSPAPSLIVFQHGGQQRYTRMHE
jgi:CubicO group peptidase (beta-lactamase class C family)